MMALDRATLARTGAVAILILLLLVLWIGPVGAYVDLVQDGAGEIAQKAALLQRYRALADVGSSDRTEPARTDPALLIPAIPDAQAGALVQETVKSAAAAAQVQIQGLQVLRGEARAGSPESRCASVPPVMSAGSGGCFTQSRRRARCSIPTTCRSSRRPPLLGRLPACCKSSSISPASRREPRRDRLGIAGAAAQSPAPRNRRRAGRAGGLALAAVDRTGEIGCRRNGYGGDCRAGFASFATGGKVRRDIRAAAVLALPQAGARRESGSGGPWDRAALPAARAD